MNDIKAAWKVILSSVFIAFIIGFIYLCLLKCLSGVIVWGMLIGTFVLFMIIGTSYYNQAQTKEDAEDYVDFDSKEGSLTVAYLCYILAAVIFCFVICMYNRIKLAIAIVKTTSDYISDVKSIILVPILAMVVYLAFYAIWISGFVYMYSKGSITSSEDEFNPFPVVTLEGDLRFEVAYYVFCGLWTNAFISAVIQFIIASAAVIWYFKQERASMPITRSLYRAFRFHLGSLAFGSLVLAILQMLQLIMLYVQSVTKASGS